MSIAITNLTRIADMVGHAAERTGQGRLIGEEHFAIGTQLAKAQTRLGEVDAALASLASPSSEAARGHALLTSAITDLGAARASYDDAARSSRLLSTPSLLMLPTRDARATAPQLAALAPQLHEIDAALRSAPDVRQLADVGRELLRTASREADAALPAHVFAPDADIDAQVARRDPAAYARVNHVWMQLTDPGHTRVHGSGNVPADGAFLLAVGPHDGWTDPSRALAGTDRFTRLVMSSELTRLPLVGARFLDLGAIEIVRGGGGGERMMAIAERALAQGDPATIFPAGGLSRMPGARPGRDAIWEDHGSGAARLALQGYPVVPAGIDGAGPRFVQLGAAPGRGVHVSYGAPLYFGRIDAPTREQVGGVREVVREEIYRQADVARQAREAALHD